MFTVINLADGIDLRPLELGDSSELVAAYVRNRAHLAPWEPARSDEFFTEAAQAADLRSKVAATAAGSAYSLGLFDGTTIVGRFNLSGIVRGPFQNAGLGYWVDAQYAGRGLATAAVQAIVRVARDDLGLHRVEASTLLHNHGSQRVLHKAGFEHIGMAPSYLRIAGTWQDHNLYQVILHR